MTKAGLLLVLSGPSGVGKDTVLQHLLPMRSDCALSVSAATRNPRPHEVEGKDYYFIDRERFGELVARGEMLEYASYSGNLYGTPRGPVDRQLAEGKNVILEIDVQGALKIKELRPDAVFVFVMPPSWQCLKKRLTDRGTETAQSLETRLTTAREEMQRVNLYDYILVNSDVQRCAEDLSAVITAAGCSAHHMQKIIEEVCADA